MQTHMAVSLRADLHRERCVWEDKAIRKKVHTSFGVLEKKQKSLVAKELHSKRAIMSILAMYLR